MEESFRNEELGLGGLLVNIGSGDYKGDIKAGSDYSKGEGADSNGDNENVFNAEWMAKN